MHDRIAGVPPSAEVLDEMARLIEFGVGSETENAQLAAELAMQHPDFYRTTLKNFSTPWTNRDADPFAALNDYSATVIGVVRDDVDFRQILSANIIYVAATNTGVAAYSTLNNQHYEDLESQGVDLAVELQRQQQSSFLDIPAAATAGVMTTRAAAKAFFIAGTNRAMFRFTLVNHLCVDLEQVSDISRAPDRIRQDVTRSPGGDSRLFRNNCIGCHSGMDPMAQAFAYYNYEYDADNDPAGEAGQLTYNSASETDSATGSRVVAKYHINATNFPFGFVTDNDRWDNYWRAGSNQFLAWDQSLPGTGAGAKSMGEELASSGAFSSCQVTKVFKQVCLREPTSVADQTQIDVMANAFSASGFLLKQPFAAAASYCRGE
ncbi:MAG: hypothetical protein KUG79_13640 [Pseudomonadales bacterium]|nr:hypothetical protein [Pseudomonadales bacterium]